MSVALDAVRPRIIDQPLWRHGIVGRSRAIADVIRRLELVAATRSTVLITGETGTGKELVARAIHTRSAQHQMPFVKVNCAAIPDTLLESELFGHVKGAFTNAITSRKGRFALAHRGTIFLDEIGTMNAALQAKLLRVLQEREIEPLGAERSEHVDVRVIAATNRNLRDLVKAGRFQDDLYYRLQVFPIVVPPLRDRLDDVPLLAQHFLHKHAQRSGRSIETFEPGVMLLLQTYQWPGNIRELENAIERAVVVTTGTTIGREAITLDEPVDGGLAPSEPTAPVPSLKLHDNIEWIECATIRRALDLTTEKQQAARILGISPRALSYYLGKYPFLAPKRSEPRVDID
jgi:transcriptional regulator with GAF, ATPase, and Fis domain